MEIIVGNFAFSKRMVKQQKQKKSIHSAESVCTMLLDWLVVTSVLPPSPKRLLSLRTDEKL